MINNQKKGKRKHEKLNQQTKRTTTHKNKTAKQKNKEDQHCDRYLSLCSLLRIESGQCLRCETLVLLLQLGIKLHKT